MGYGTAFRQISDASELRDDLYLTIAFKYLENNPL